MALIVAGLDLSLTATGVSCVFDLDGQIEIECTTFGRKGKRNEPVLQRGERLRTLAEEIVTVASGAELAVIEGPSTHSIGGSTHDRSGLWWLVVDLLQRELIPVAVAPPAVRAKWATGSGNADKVKVKAMMQARFPTVPLRDDNEADALALASLGMEWLQRSLGPATGVQRSMLEKVEWPVIPRAHAAPHAGAHAA